MREDIFEIDSIDFYNYDKLDKLHEMRSRKWLKLFFKTKNGNQKDIEVIRKHEAQDKELKRRSRLADYYWG